jgi:hypothetical protein
MVLTVNSGLNRFGRTCERDRPHPYGIGGVKGVKKAVRPANPISVRSAISKAENQSMARQLTTTAPLLTTAPFSEAVRIARVWSASVTRFALNAYAIGVIAFLLTKFYLVLTSRLVAHTLVQRLHMKMPGDATDCAAIALPAHMPRLGRLR